MSKVVIDSARYRPDIDGLRAIAVLAVVLYHVDPLRCSGGFVGVDIFFVISGFLITGLILRDFERHEFSLADFYARRIRRILPALVAMEVFVLGAGICFLLPSDLKNLADSAIAQTLMVANFYFVQDIDYFTGPAETKPLLHTWSLAVEEQFYLVYPAALLLWHRLQAGRLLMVLSSAALVSFVISIYGPTIFQCWRFICCHRAPGSCSSVRSLLYFAREW